MIEDNRLRTNEWNQPSLLDGMTRVPSDDDIMVCRKRSRRSPKSALSIASTRPASLPPVEPVWRIADHMFRKQRTTEWRLVIFASPSGLDTASWKRPAMARHTMTRAQYFTVGPTYKHGLYTHPFSLAPRSNGETIKQSFIFSYF